MTLIANQTMTVIRRAKGKYVDSVWVEGEEKSLKFKNCTIQAMDEDMLVRVPEEGGIRSRARYSVTGPVDMILKTAGDTRQSPDLVLFKGQRWEVHAYGDYPNLIKYSHYILAKPEMVQE